MGDVLGLSQPYGVGLGQQFPFKGIDPAAGANFSLSPDGRFLRRFLSLIFTLTTDNNAANRYVTVEIQGKDGNAVTVNAAAVTVSASSTQRFVFAAHRGVAEWATNTDILAPIEPSLIFPGDTLAIVVASKQAGDTLTLIRGVEERFPLDADQLPVLSSE